MKHNQMLHFLDEQGVSLCGVENVARKYTLEWLAFEETGGRSVCKNCQLVKELNEETAQYRAAME